MLWGIWVPNHFMGYLQGELWIGPGMLPDDLVAVLLVFYLVTFLGVNLHSVISSHRRRTREKRWAEVPAPSGLSGIWLPALGTLSFFLLMVVYPSSVLLGLKSWWAALQLQFPLAGYVQVLGIATMGAGWFLFLWSVVVRGRYSVSWAMGEHHKLITWGPYRYVRHPSYLGYFLMFIGLFLIWLNLIALIPMTAIPGYARITHVEEEQLVRRFGEEYERYQIRTGRLLPRR